MFGIIMLAVVAVAVTIATSGALLAATGAVSGGFSAGVAATLGIGGAAGVAGSVAGGAATLMAAGAIGGAVGSIVSQGLGVLTGIQDKFSWKGVALGALGGAIGGATGVGGLMGKAGAFSGVGNAFAQGALRGTLSSGLAQGIGVATGLQKKFDFAGIAAAAVGGGVSAHIGSKLGIGTNLSVANVSKSLAVSMAGNLANAGARSLISGTDFGDNILAALPDVIANTIGGMIGAAAADENYASGLTDPMGRVYELLENPPDFMPATEASWAGASGDDRILLAAAGTLPEGMLAAQATAQTLPEVRRLPGGRVRIGNVIYTAVQILELVRTSAERSQVNGVIERFGLNARDATHMLAARAYVWGSYNLPAIVENVGFSGPTNDAASQGLMRATMVDPGIFVRALYGSNPDQRLLYAVAAGNAANADRSRARPRGVEPALQTTSRAARAALAQQLNQPGRWQVHHLVPAEVWGTFAPLARLAQQQGWHQDSVDNLIILPADAATQARSPGNLPIHNGYHRRYNEAVTAQVQRYVNANGGRVNAYQARGILDLVAAQQRAAIMGHVWNPRVN